MSHPSSPFVVQNLFNVKGWVVVVTGGGTGIGLMAAQAFANNGARVYIVGRRSEALDQACQVHGQCECGGKLIPITADMSSKDSIGALATEIAKNEKYINVLINNAGIMKSNDTITSGGEPQALEFAEGLWKESFEDWANIYQTNVIGYYFAAAAFLPLLAAATQSTTGHSGSIINIASVAGLASGSEGSLAYGTSKAAVTQLSNLLAHQFIKTSIKVRVNSIAPGLFPSEMTTGQSNEAQKSHIQGGESFRKEKNIPAGRPGRDEDIAQAVLALACNMYVNGQTLPVDGGFLLTHA